jgi:hypothetical protein
VLNYGEIICKYSNDQSTTEVVSLLFRFNSQIIFAIIVVYKFCSKIYNGNNVVVKILDTKLPILPSFSISGIIILNGLEMLP